MEKVIARARPLVVPDDAARRKTLRVAEKVVSKVKEAARPHPEVAGVFLGGSFAKDTWLPGDVDIDVFVKIATSVDEQSFEEVGLAVGREALRGYKPGKKYAQHPYTEAVVDGFKVTWCRATTSSAASGRAPRTGRCTTSSSSGRTWTTRPGFRSGCSRGS